MDDTAPLILVADDNADIRRLVERRLGRRGFTIITAADGRSALEVIREHRPDAAILDWVMPELEGDAVCREVKGDPATASTRIVLLTARAAEDDVAAGTRAGADAYLTKPFTIEELESAVREALAGDT